MPFVVGGSGLYLRALFEGLAEVPEVPEAVRQQVQSDLEDRGLESLRRELAAGDPHTSERLEPGDTQRICRAVEILRATGAPQSLWLKRQRTAGSGLRPVKIGLTLPRALLYDKISARARQMLANGWVEEVRALAARYPHDAPAFQAIGYRELLRFVSSPSIPPSQENPPKSDFEVVVDQILVATRRYAKRQETWFRREAGIRWLNPLEIEPAFDELVNHLRSHVIRSREP